MKWYLICSSSEIRSLTRDNGNSEYIYVYGKTAWRIEALHTRYFIAFQCCIRKQILKRACRDTRDTIAHDECDFSSRQGLEGYVCHCQKARVRSTGKDYTEKSLSY